MPPQNVPPNANDDITLATVVEVLSDGPEIRYPADVFPTSGRVLKHPETGDIYLGDGQQFHNVSSAVGLDTPSTTTDEASIKNITSSPDLGTNQLKSVGHDDTDLPQSVERTVADFEGGTLPQDAVGNTGNATVQSGTVLEGSYSLEISSSSTTSEFVGLKDDRDTLPQFGDQFTVYFYLTDTEDRSNFAFSVTDTSKVWFRTTSLAIRVRADKNTLSIDEHVNGNRQNQNTSTADISNHINETLTADVTVTSDGVVELTLYDSVGSVLATETLSSGSKIPETGGVQYRIFNGINSPTAYFDGPFVTRREPEARAETKGGTTPLGNEVTPTGAMHTGPLEVPPDHPNYPVLNLPVTDDMAQGDQVGYHLAIDEQSALTVEAEADGNGGVQNRQVRSHDPLTTANIDTERIWQDETTNRAAGTDYTNDSGGEIWVAVSVKSTADGTNVGINIDGDSTVAPSGENPGEQNVTLDTSQILSVKAIIPQGSTYRVGLFRDTANFDIERWLEFKQ